MNQRGLQEMQREERTAEERRGRAHRCLLDSLSVCFLTPTTAPGIQLSVISLQAAAQRSILSRILAAAPACILAAFRSSFPLRVRFREGERGRNSLMSSCPLAFFLTEAHFFCAWLSLPGPLCEWDVHDHSVIGAVRREPQRNTGCSGGSNRV